MTRQTTSTRRRYSAEFMAQVISECGAPGVSVAKVAMLHGMNANIIHGWRQLARERFVGHVSNPPAPRAFVPVQLESPNAPGTLGAAQPSIEVQLQRGAVTMKITWPLGAGADFAAWTRELLR
jgi:transposase